MRTGMLTLYYIYLEQIDFIHTYLYPLFAEDTETFITQCLCTDIAFNQKDLSHLFVFFQLFLSGPNSITIILTWGISQYPQS